VQNKNTLPRTTGLEVTVHSAAVYEAMEATELLPYCDIHPHEKVEEKN